MTRKVLLVLRLAGADLKGNLAVNLVALLIIAAAFLTVGVFILVAVNLRALAGHWQERIQVCVYLADGATVLPAQMQQRLAARPEVAAVKYVSKEEALVEFKSMLGDQTAIIEGLDANPLPASFTLQLKNDARGLDRVKALAAELSAWPGVEEADYGGPWLEGFTSALRLAQAGTVVLAGLIGLAVILIIGNTVRLTVYSRKEEIGIMRLVGAGPLLIRAPFMLEGMLAGGGAATIAIAVLYLLYRVLLVGRPLPSLLAGFGPVFISGPPLIALILAGAALGAVASLTKFSNLFKT
jgi:cell division transport system permease protein